MVHLKAVGIFPSRSLHSIAFTQIDSKYAFSKFTLVIRFRISTRSLDDTKDESSQ